MHEDVPTTHLLQKDALGAVVEEAGEVEREARLGEKENDTEGVVLDDGEAAVP